ncbi:MAG: hypothetical protein LBI44_07635 [Oscillospiraceae bacterium]|jgi:hypothetical protein|nr:hypothetical protein [Oscillospiraceae bacterium]
MLAIHGLAADMDGDGGRELVVLRGNGGHGGFYMTVFRGKTARPRFCPRRTVIGTTPNTALAARALPPRVR